MSSQMANKKKVAEEDNTPFIVNRNQANEIEEA
jgi:hypothetical protein